MAAKSPFLPRLSFSRGDNPIIPLHNSTIRKKPSEYDMSDLSPRPEEAFLSPKPQSSPGRSSSGYRSASPQAPYSDRVSTAGSPSKTRQRALFVGPPPPIAASRVLYRDEEDNTASSPPRGLEASSFSRNINSAFFDRSVPARGRDKAPEYEPDTAWRNLQRREKTLQKELQHLLDAQSAGLAANLDPNAAPPSSTRSDASDAGSSTPTGTLYTNGSGSRRTHVTFEEPLRATSTGEIIPVRQPRKKPLGLRAARTGLARNITLLADLKIEEDASLSSALSIRRKALGQLRKLAMQREGIAEELNALEAEEEEPLARELRELGDDHHNVTTEIAELEERLVGLRNRKRWLDGRIDEVKNRREAGLSGYKGALKDVESRVSAILTKPPVKPLDIEVIAGPRGHEGEHNGHGDEVEQSSGGTEFLRLRPERRTIEMAKEWWESEVAILERRRGEVDKERVALEEGVEIWKDAVKVVSDFEADLRKEMKAGVDPDADGGAKGKSAASTPEQAMLGQLKKMASVATALEERLHVAEEKGWNLLICAIGAELAAFREAEHMLRGALREAGLDVDGDGKEADDERHTPRLGRSAGSLRGSTVFKTNGSDPSRSSGANSPLALHERVDAATETSALENDNEVPLDLLVDPTHASPALSREDSENEVPPEFLAQHHGDDDVE